MADCNEAAILAAYECPAGGLCDCTHPGGEHACSYCGCYCPLPNPDDTNDHPDRCPCCYRIPDWM